LLLEGIIVRFPGNFWRQWQEWSAGIGKKRTEAHSVEFIRVYPKSRLQERCTPCNVEQQSCTEGRDLSSCWLVIGTTFLPIKSSPSPRSDCMSRDLQFLRPSGKPRSRQSEPFPLYASGDRLPSAARLLISPAVKTRLWLAMPSNELRQSRRWGQIPIR